MDEVLRACDEAVLARYVYPASWPAGDMRRQALGLYLIGLVGGYALYLIFGGLAYEFLFDKALLKHPKALKNQVARELWSACRSIPFMVALQIPFFLAEVRGHTRLTDRVESWGYEALAILSFMAFNDFMIYWIHRGLHHPRVYKYLHKEHHTWLVPTPFASHAFHPFDGFMQGLPYSLFIFIMPLNKYVHLGMFILVNYWTISIHVGPPYSQSFPYLEKWARLIVNGPAHHTDHHLYYSYNYGQYTTLWDRIGGTYMEPTTFLGKGPGDEVHKSKKL